MKLALLMWWIGVCAATAAQAVSSGFVPVRGPMNVFDPIPEASGGNDTARLVDTTNMFTAAYTEDFPIDGDLTKSVWQRAEPCGPFLRIKGKTTPPETAAQTVTDIRLLYSASALYIGATFRQPMDKIRAQYDQDDQPIHNDDNVEILFLVPSGKGEDMLHLAVNALGSCWDAKNGRSVWNVKGREVRTKRFADRWTMEAKLPFAGLKIERPVPDDFIGVRFCRFVSEPRTRTSVPQLESVGNNQRRKFAKLLFGEPGGKAAAEMRSYRERIGKERAAQRLAAARRRVVVQEASAVQFQDQTHPVYNHAVQAIHQMKSGLEKFEAGKLATADFIALDAGFRKYAGEHAYAVWTASPWEKGSPDRLPPATCAGLPRLRFEQAGNEREAVCLEFTGLLCGPRIDLRIVPQSIDEPARGRFVSCDSFEIYEEPFVMFEKDLITAPLVQKDGNIVTLTPGRTTRVWVMFNSRGVKSGDYRTRILLKPAYDVTVAEQAIDVEMKVWRFALPETRDWPLKTFFWGSGTFLYDETHALKLMHSHHVTHGWTRGFNYWCGLARNGNVGKRDVDTFKKELAETANEEFFRTAKELGMRFVFGWNTPYCREWFETMERRLRGMGFEYEDFVFKTLIADEFVKASIPKNAARRAELAPHVSNLWFQAVYLSTPPPTGATMDDIEEAKLPEFYRMWTVIDGVFRDPVRGPDVTRRLRAKGCKVWTYTCARYMQTQDILGYYRFYLWRAYMRGLDGAAMWTSGRRSGDDGWDSRDGYDDGILWCGNNKRMIPTKRFEAFREGLEDVAYMDLLKKVGGKDAKALLDARDEVIKAHDQKALDAWRLAAGWAIDSLVDKK